MDFDQPDFSIRGSMSIFLLCPRSHPAKSWAREHITDGLPPATFIPVEHRYIGDICRGILRDGLTMELDGQTYYENEDGELVAMA